MSWSDFYPVFEDSQSAEYEDVATGLEKSELEDWCAVSRRINERPARHRVSVSLFWKNLVAEERELAVVSREQMMDADRLGLISRYAPWDHYVQPLLKGAVLLQKARPDVVLRVYLAADLEFVIEDLVRAGCEVFLMKSASLRHNPGAMWRFLALEAADEWITVIDADRGLDIVADVERSEQAMAAGLGMWRTPYFFDVHRHRYHMGYYRPINACQFGARGGQPVQQLMKAFIWHNRRGTMRTTWQEPGDRGEEKPSPIAATTWPSYGFDEWFLLAALYPRWAFEGVLTFFHWQDPQLGFCQTLDIEYVTWANPNSEVFRCPEPPAGKSKPWEEVEHCPRLVVRGDAAVVRRERERIGPAHRILMEPPIAGMKGTSTFDGSLPELLSRAGDEVSKKFWVDLNPRLRLGDNGGELFTDLCFSDMDVVTCGNFFTRVSREAADWASGQGLCTESWQEGRILKVPKLEGPMTLWNTSFSVRFREEWSAAAALLQPETMLRAWIDLGRAKVGTTTALSMGWEVR
ncbi:MAG: hypothetical protein EOP88_07240 [Verrucomicrobiaceae bacterium]|nr:MAG: hypothetical protein EOP88_07240 [Verrucomicrobiaceae bacterium]